MGCTAACYGHGSVEKSKLVLFTTSLIHGGDILSRYRPALENERETSGCGGQGKGRIGKLVRDLYVWAMESYSQERTSERNPHSYLCITVFSVASIVQKPHPHRGSDGHY